MNRMDPEKLIRAVRIARNVLENGGTATEQVLLALYQEYASLAIEERKARVRAEDHLLYVYDLFKRNIKRKAVLNPTPKFIELLDSIRSRQSQTQTEEPK